MESLFTNVPLQRTLRIIEDRIYNKKLVKTKLKKSTLRKLIRDTCTKTVFSCNNKLYEQTDGVSMCGSLDPVLANIIMTEFEHEIVKKLIDQGLIAFYCRYDLIVATLQLKKPRPKHVYITRRSFKYYNKAAFLEDISKAPWSVIEASDDVEDKLYTFNSPFTQILDQHAPPKTVKLRTRPTPFIDDNIRALMKTRNHWQKLVARQTNDPAAWSGYKNFKQEVKRELRIAQRNFVEDSISQNANYTNAMWKTIRSCIL